MKTITNGTPKWYKNLSHSFWVNSVGISNHAGRVVAGTFFHDYTKPGSGPNTKGTFGTYCYDANGTQLWCDEFEGVDGIFGVAISGDGNIAAAAGWHDQDQALLRAYDATTGTSLLDYTEIQHRVSCVSLSDDGNVLAAAADDVYLFVKTGTAFPATPVKMGIADAAHDFVSSVAVDPGGNWLAACDTMGNVHLGVISGGKIQKQIWTAPEVPLDPSNPGSGSAPVPFLSVQVAKNSRAFVVGGGDLVYLFDADALQAPIKYDTRDANTPTAPAGRTTAPENLRWVAISGDGTLVSAVANRLDAAKKPDAGLLVLLSRKDGQLCKVWDEMLDRNPNSTSMNSAGTYVSLADGYPLGTPGKFCLFDASGNELWRYSTSNMNWPMVVSPCGAGIAAGGDDGNFYYLSEPEKEPALRTS